MSVKGNPIEILLVEDNPGDVRLMHEVFKESGVSNNLTVAVDGEEAMAALLKLDKYTNIARPNIIFLDLNLPGKDGREVLSEIKQNRQLKRIPVVVLTTSRAQEDIVKSYDLHANCYVVKPLDLDSFLNIMKSIKEFWLTVVSLPDES